MTTISVKTRLVTFECKKLFKALMKFWKIYEK